MKKNKTAIIILVVLCALTAILAAVHLTTRQSETEGAIRVVNGNDTVLVYVDDLTPVVDVNGTVVNNAGEEKMISGRGIAIRDVLALAGIDRECDVLITSADEYTVELSAVDISENGKAWLLIQEDGSLRLIVFNDEGARRNVKDVVRISIK